MQGVFPFTAIVGQGELRRALVLHAVRPGIGGVLIRGERGTAKSTAARGLAALLPPIEVAEGCPYGCHPAEPYEGCPVCSGNGENGSGLAPRAILRPTPFINLPVGATEDRVVGTLDIERILRSGERHFEPGILAEANRGVLYIDEVNLLDDHVVDVLLDASAMGVNVVEREGVSFSHPSRFVLIGTMNPEEGELRPQLTDRFGLSVTVRAVPSLQERSEILRRRLQFDSDPESFAAAWSSEEEALRETIIAARSRLPEVAVGEADLQLIAEIAQAAGVDGHRSELAIVKAAQANAALDGRLAISVIDIRLAARLALGHRQRRVPLEGSQSSGSAVEEVLERAEYASALDAEPTVAASPEARSGERSALSADELKRDARYS